MAQRSSLRLGPRPSAPPDEVRTHPRASTDAVVVPRRCTLDGFAEEVSRADGIGLADLDPITTLLVRTENSLYQITVVQPRQTNVLVQGGEFFPETTPGSPQRVELRRQLLENGLGRCRPPHGVPLRRRVDHHVARPVDFHSARRPAPRTVLAPFLT